MRARWGAMLQTLTLTRTHRPAGSHDLQALGVYTVKANETTWEHVCGSCCSSQLVAELNGGAATPTAGSKIFMPTLG